LAVRCHSPRSRPFQIASGGGKCHTSTVQFSSPTYSVTEGDVTAPIIVTRVGATDTPATFNFATSAGSATSGAAADYDDVNSTGVTFNAGEVSKIVTVPIHDDAVYENAETVNLALSSIATSPATTAGTPLAAVLTINPDGDAQPTLSINDRLFSTGDNLTVAGFTVTLSGATQVYPVRVHYKSADITANAGFDYTAVEGDLQFNLGRNNQGYSHLDHRGHIQEPDETFAINLTAPINAGFGDNQGIGTIHSGDTSVASIGNVTQFETNSGTTTFAFPVTLSNPSSTDTTVFYSTSNGTATTANNDYVGVTNGSIVIPR